jgi:hypothetical protein
MLVLLTCCAGRKAHCQPWWPDGRDQGQQGGKHGAVTTLWQQQQQRRRLKQVQQQRWRWWHQIVPSLWLAAPGMRYNALGS